MYSPNQTQTNVRLANKLFNRPRWRTGLFVIWLTLAVALFSPGARATCQEGCLSNFNTALGEDALLNNTGGFSNTASGFGALGSNTTGPSNTATGVNALFRNTIANDNTATGAVALQNNATGNNNTATGAFALNANATGSDNTADGQGALQNNTGSNNIAVGHEAGINLTAGNHNIDIGSPGAPGEFKTIRLGKSGLQTKTLIAGISGATVPTGVTVIVGTNGQLGTITSSARFKESIQPMDTASKAILALRPVTFRYKKELDPQAVPQFGLVAEDVAKVSPDLVARDEEGKPYSVRYEAVNAMLLNEFLKEHRKVEEQGGEIAELKRTVNELKSALKQQAVEVKQVQDQIGAGAPGPRLVTND